jgi:ABC-type sugar transport system substrate-binding protein
MKKSIILTVLGIVFLGLTVLLTGCGNKTATNTSQKQITIGFANMADSIPFCTSVKNGLIQAAQAQGWKVTAVDNNLDGQKAVENTKYLIQSGVNMIVMYNIDAATQPAVAQLVTQAKIPALALDISMPGYPFFGVNNQTVGQMGGGYLANYFKTKWNRQPDLFVVLDNPMGGQYAKDRSDALEQGFLAVYPDFPKADIVRVDAKSDVLPAQQAMTYVLTAHPNAKYIAVSGINDEVCNGGFDALKAANRDQDAEVVSLGADSSFLDHLKATKGQDAWNAAVAFTPEDYGKEMMPVLQNLLNGQQVAPETYVTNFVVDSTTVGKYYPAYTWQQ